MLLTGTYRRSLDDKLRFALPKALREGLGGAVDRPLFFAPGSDGSLAIYPEVSFQRLAERLEASSPAATEIREYRRLFFARATRVDLDRSGRLRLPQQLAELSHLASEIVLIGVQDHIEIWSGEAWNAYLNGRSDNYDAIAEAAFAAPLPSINSEDLSIKQQPRLPR